MPIDPVQRTWRFAITDGGAHDFAAHHPAQPQCAHQPLDCATGHRHAFACQLPPHLVGAVDLHVGLPDAFNLRHKHLVTVSTRTALMGRAQQRRMPTICRRGNLQDLAERLDPIGIAVLIDESP
jgi:hypothetical protein